MDIRVLKYFLAVAREENITKAADVLHITQPTLSRQLLKLEDERYWLGEDGVMASNQWHQTEEGKWYYLQEDGKAMRNGWKLIDGDHYYFMKSGVMAVDSLVSGKYRVGPDGRWVH